jgi:CBS domain-containing protein
MMVRNATMKLNDIFPQRVVSAGPEESLAAVALRMQEHNVGTVVVVEDQRPVGIITDRDLALALGAKGISPQAPARKEMTRHVQAIPEDMGIFTATNFIKDLGVRRLPIVDSEDHLVGLVSLDDLLQFLVRELSNLVEGVRHEMKVK